ncbi:MAG: type transport system permease protein [Thermoplasmata archaeon]|nr:type transport system permease protein [Thermoplasmata archaeon]
MSGLATATGELFRKTLRQFPRVPPDIIQAILIPLFLFALFSLQMASVARLPGFPTGSYAAFLLPQIITFTAFTSANGAGYALVLEARSGYLDKLRAMPIPRASIVLGRLLAVGLRAALQALLILAIAFPFGIRVGEGLLGVVGILLLAAFLAICWAGLVSTLGLLTRSPEAVEASTVLFIPLVYLTTGAMPLSLMSPGIQRVVAANPVTYIVEAVRAMSLATGDALAILVGFGAAILLALAGVGAATWAMARLDRA